MRRAEAEGAPRKGARREVWALALILFAATDPAYLLLLRGPSDWASDALLTEINGARQMVWAGLYAACAALAWRARAAGTAALMSHPVLPLALIWFAASCLWSPAPLDAALGLVQFTLLLAAGAALAARAGPMGTVEAVARMGWLALGAAAAMAIASPEHAFGQEVNAGALRGIYVEKNHLAMVLSHAVAAALFEAAARPERLRPWLIAGALIAGVVLARSSIALVQLVLSVGLAGAWLGLGRARYGAAATVAGGLAALTALGAALPLALAVLGEDMTLNDRTVLWAALWPSVAEAPLIGHGFFGFWTPETAARLRAEMGWNARGAHNGWLTALLYGGTVGLGLWLAHWAGPARRALAALAPPHGPGDAGRAGLGALIAAHLIWSLFESNQLMQMNFHALLAGVCLALPVAGAARPSHLASATPAARHRNSGLPTT